MATNNPVKDSVIRRVQQVSGRLYRFFCGNRLACEKQAASFVSIFQFNGQLLAQRDGDGVNFFASLLVTDSQSSVLGVVSADCSSWPIAYTPYGWRSPSMKTAVNGFNGERPDSVTQNYLLGNGCRQFNMSLRRFYSPDSLSPFGAGGLNFYCYCVGDPINLHDPDGRNSKPNWTPKLPVHKLSANSQRRVAVNTEYFNLNIVGYKNLRWNTRPRSDSAPSLAVSPPPLGQAPKGWDRIGSHGGRGDDAKSLLRGLDPAFLTRRSGGQESGAGFYMAVDPSSWPMFSTAPGLQSFHVYTQNMDRLKLGEHIDFTPAINQSGPMQIIIRQSAYPMIAVREQSVGAVVRPRSYEAPF